MLRFGNGLILSGLAGMSMIGAPLSWMIAAMVCSFFIGFIFPAVQ